MIGDWRQTDGWGTGSREAGGRVVYRWCTGNSEADGRGCTGSREADGRVVYR